MNYRCLVYRILQQNHSKLLFPTYIITKLLINHSFTHTHTLCLLVHIFQYGESCFYKSKKILCLDMRDIACDERYVISGLEHDGAGTEDEPGIKSPSLSLWGSVLVEFSHICANNLR